MIIKMEAVESRISQKGISKKIRCPEHDFKYVFKCNHPNCISPFICSAFECIDSHAHEEEQVTMTRFKIDSINSKFAEVEGLILDDSLNENARAMKVYIESLKDSIKNVYVGIKNLNQNYDYLEKDIESPLNQDYIKKVEESFLINQNVRKTLDELKEKVKLEFPAKDSYFPLKFYLSQFLVDSIPEFSWAKSLEIYSSRNDLVTVEKFHERLSGLRDLCFIFVGETRVIGSYFPGPYPTLNKKAMKDDESFIFMNGKEKNATVLYKFSAIPSAEHHLSISEKNYICQGNTPSYGDGIRTFHKNFENLEYCLPSNSFAASSSQFESMSGTLKVKMFMVLQVQRETVTNEEDELD